jgi:hypothetical protein
VTSHPESSLYHDIADAFGVALNRDFRHEIHQEWYDKLTMPSRGHGVAAAYGLPRKKPWQVNVIGKETRNWWVGLAYNTLR